MKKNMFILSILLFVGINLFSQNNIHLVCEEWEGYTNADGTGLYWEIVKAVFEPEGYNVELDVYPWARCVNLVKSKSVDGVVGDYFYEDSSDYEYSEYPVSIEDSIVVIYKTSRMGAWRGADSMEGKTVGWIRSYDFDSYLDFEVSIQELNQLDSGLRMLSGNRIDYLMDYTTTITMQASESGINLNNYTIKPVIEGNPLYIGFAKNSKADNLISIFDRRIIEMINNGELKEIYDRWPGIKDYGEFETAIENMQ